MNDVNPWRIPAKKKGYGLSPATFKLDSEYLQAVTELAKIETERYDVKISQATIIVNTSTRNGAYFVERRSWLLKRYKQLKRGNDESTKVWDIKRAA
jgi:hypothetical protein